MTAATCSDFYGVRRGGLDKTLSFTNLLMMKSPFMHLNGYLMWNWTGIRKEGRRSIAVLGSFTKV